MTGPASKAVAASQGQPAIELRACGRWQLEIEGELRGRWAEAIKTTCASLADLTDVDATARVLARMEHGELVVEVHLPDGRSASRRVSSPSALTPTLEALLAVPPAPRATPAIDQANPPDLKPPQSEPTPPYGVEAGVGIGGRLSGSGPYLAASLAGLVQARVHAWVLGLGMRWDAIQRLVEDPPPGFESEALAIMLTVARRLELQPMNIDIGLSPRLISQIQTAQLPTGEQTGSDTDLRLGAFVRAASRSGTVRVFVEADAEISPPRFDRHLQVLPGFPDLPTWSTGLTLGTQWSPP
jgi:hypothetical protein